MKKREHLLMVADTEHDADMLYTVGVFVPDPFIFLRTRGRNYVVMSDLEWPSSGYLWHEHQRFGADHVQGSG